MSMEHVQIQTTQNVGIDFEVAGIGDRVIAALIDYFILGCYVWFVIIMIALVESTAVAVIFLLPFFFYFLLCEIFFNGQSIGKYARRIKVARLDGSQPTWANYLLRWLFRLVEIDLTTGLVALITMLVNGKGQRLGDLAAGTTVVRVKPRVRLRDTILAQVEEDYTPTFTDLGVLTDSDITTAKEVLNTLIAEGRTRTAFQLGNRMKTALEQKLDLTSDLPPLDFLRTLIKDYNYERGRL